MSEDMIDAGDDYTFRTFDEMREVYDRIHEGRIKGHPYEVVYELPGRYFGVIGSSHSNDPENPQWSEIFEQWDKFVASANPQKVVFNEGNGRPPRATTREEAIRDGADSGTTAWLAKEAGISCSSPEPSRAEEITALRTKYGFSEDEIMNYYLGRQMGQWLRYDHEKGKALSDYVADTVGHYTKSYEWEQDYTAERARQVVESFIGKKLEDGTSDDFMKIEDPYQNKVAAASSDFRNQYLFGQLRSAWEEGKDVFCVYGSGHAIVLEPALRKLIEQVSNG